MLGMQKQEAMRRMIESEPVDACGIALIIGSDWGGESVGLRRAFAKLRITKQIALTGVRGGLGDGIVSHFLSAALLRQLREEGR